MNKPLSNQVTIVLEDVTDGLVPDELWPTGSQTRVTGSKLDPRVRDYVHAGKADNTRRAYTSGIRHYQAWGGPLPASPTDVANYLVSYATELNARTLALRVTALARWHRAQDLVDPTTSDTVKTALTGIKRKHGVPPKKARALTVPDLQKMVDHLSSCDTLAAKRDSALLQVGFFGGFRRSELAALAVAYIEFEVEGIVVTLPRSKTDQEGRGKKKAIPSGRTGKLCPVRALKVWLEAAGIHEGPVFRAVSRGGKIRSKQLNDGSINDILERRANEAGLEFVPDLSSHSLRRGMATSAARAGASEKKIQTQGGWKDPRTVQGYIDEATLFDDNAVGTLLDH